ncbi:MAG: 1,2-phenylacetyl-CoA epoxidase subunit PaaC [Egibacteraceae bacterium]
MSEARLQLLLALADDELVIGHRHSHWTGVAPHLEEDLAFSSIAQDEIGHAVVWYSLAAELTGKDGLRALAPAAPEGGDPLDVLGLGRRPEQYRNAILVERPNRDWGYTVARHYLYDVAEDVRLTALAESAWTPLADATGALRREERYHLLHARTWLDRLAHGHVDARSHLVDGLVAAVAESPGLFEPTEGESELVADGVLPADSAAQRARWRQAVSADLVAHDLEFVLDGSAHHLGGEFVPTSSGELLTEALADGAAAAGDHGLGGRRGRHTADFAEVWEEMTGTYRAHPGARW